MILRDDVISIIYDWLIYARVSVRKTVSLRRVALAHPTLPDCLLAIRATPLLFFDREGLPIS